MSPELAKLDLRITNSIQGLSLTQTQATPAACPDKWNIQQIVEHLLLTYQSTCAVLETRIAKTFPTRATPTLYQRLGQFTVLRLGLFPSGRTAPISVTPSALLEPKSGTELASILHLELARMDVLITRAESIFGSSRRAISHQVLGPLSTRQWRAFHLVHGQHHAKQIEAIRNDHPPSPVV